MSGVFAMYLGDSTNRGPLLIAPPVAERRGYLLETPVSRCVLGGLPMNDCTPIAAFLMVRMVSLILCR